jgi:hypothetical protein
MTHALPGDRVIPGGEARPRAACAATYVLGLKHNGISN